MEENAFVMGKVSGKVGSTAPPDFYQVDSDNSQNSTDPHCCAKLPPLISLTNFVFRRVGSEGESNK